MPYEIGPSTLRDFLEDGAIRLPRFQRKKTWTSKKRFELALSVFKNYPLGACILSREKEEGTSIKYLLDGRQRRDSLISIYNYPDSLYDWGKSYLGINDKTNAETINKKFWEKVGDFIEAVTLENKLIEGNGEVIEASDQEETDEEIVAGEETVDVDDPIPVERKGELDVLLSLLILAANYYKSGKSGITASFDIKDYFTLNKALLNDLYADNKKDIDCHKLRIFVREYRKKYGSDYDKFDSFKEYLDSKYDWKPNVVTKQTNFENEMSGEKWEVLVKIMDCFDKIDRIFGNRKIAIIETYSITPTDSQKIFNLINTGGTKLTSSEILSAKPRWNVEISGVSSQMAAGITKLYQELAFPEIKTIQFVKWDIPASLTYFLEGSDPSTSGLSLFFKFKPSDGAKRITLGFKLLSGLFGSGIKKDDTDKLSDDVIEWSDYASQLDDVKNFLDVLKNDIYLNRLKTWGKCLSDIISDAPTMNYLFLLFRSWKELGRPTGFLTTNKTIFDKNSFILLDRMIYEYTLKIWRATSDNTIANNIKAFDEKKDRNGDGLFKAVPSSSWASFIAELSEHNSINGKLIQKDDLNAVVAFYTLVTGLEGKGKDNPAEIDHILPQSAWKTSQIENKESISNNLFNLAFLPKICNASKNDHYLSDVKSNPTISAEISKYEEIEIKDFDKFSSISNYGELKKHKEQLQKQALTVTRDSIING